MSAMLDCLGSRVHDERHVGGVGAGCLTHPGDPQILLRVLPWPITLAAKPKSAI